MHKQKGMTLIGWICTLAIALLIALAALRLVPVYLQFFKIKSVMSDVPMQMAAESKVSPKAIKDYMAKRFNIEAVTVITPKDVTITRMSESYEVKVAYEHKVPYLANINFVVDFAADTEVRR